MTITLAHGVPAGWLGRPRPRASPIAKSTRSREPRSSLISSCLVKLCSSVSEGEHERLAGVFHTSRWKSMMTSVGKAPVIFSQSRQPANNVARRKANTRMSSSMSTSL